MLKKLLITLGMMLLSLPQFSLAGDFQEQKSAWQMETQGWSIQDHLIAAKEQEEAVQSLETRVQHVEKRISQLEEKPYFDPKGIKKSALKNHTGNLRGKADLLNERVAWHYKQADQARLIE